MRKFEFLIFKNAQKTAAPLNIRAECADRDSRLKVMCAYTSKSITHPK